MKDDDPRHGETRGYYAHRRAGQTACGPCKNAVAKSENMRQIRLAAGVTGRPSPTGMQRKLRALAALGYSWSSLARELGRTDAATQKLAVDPRSYANALTIKRIDALYRRLHMTLPVATSPHTAGAITAARNMARRNGWPPPLAWDDIDRDVKPYNGRRDRLSYAPAELRDEWEFLNRAGVSMNHAARQLGVSVRAIEKAIERTKEAAA